MICAVGGTESFFGWGGWGALFGIMSVIEEILLQKVSYMFG